MHDGQSARLVQPRFVVRYRTDDEMAERAISRLCPRHFSCGRNFAGLLTRPRYRLARIMLRRLAWSSVPTPSFSAGRLNEIIAPSRRNNERDHITGMLLFTGAHFLAILEGEKRDLGELWRRLEQDPRHCDLFRIGDDLCATRSYHEWRMAYEVDSEVDAQIESLHSLHSLHSLRSALDRDRGDTRGPTGPGRSLQARSTPLWARIIQPIMAHADSM